MYFRIPCVRRKDSDYPMYGKRKSTNGKFVTEAEAGDKDNDSDTDDSSDTANATSTTRDANERLPAPQEESSDFAM